MATLRSPSEGGTTEPEVLAEGLMFGESPRWREGQLWVCDWGAHELLAFDTAGNREVVSRVESFPFCIDWLPDGRIVIVSAREQALLTLRPGGALERYADLSGLTPLPPGNEIVVDGRGNAYVNGPGFDMVAGAPFMPGTVALVTSDGRARQVADGIEFPNGMAITSDESTLIVADSYGHSLLAFDIAADGSLENRRVWADLGEGTPDGICLDAEGAVWYADVPNRRCVRVHEGGEVTHTITADRGCFACMLGGEDGRTLFIVAREWHGAQNITVGGGTGQVLVAPAPVPHAGRP